MITAWFDSAHSSSDGFGHLSRCLNFAQTFNNKKIKVQFVAKTIEATKFIEDAGFEWLHSLPNSVDNQSIIIVDRYDYDDEYYFRYKKSGAYIILIDDLANRPLTCDAYVNHNLFANQLDLSCVNASAFFLGTDYGLLPEQIYEEKGKQIKRDSKYLIICFGGTDQGQYSLPVVRELIKKKLDLMVCVLTTTPIESKCDFPGNTQIKLLNNVNLITLLPDAELLVCGAGQSSLEAAALGIPFVASVIAENQTMNGLALAELGYTVFEKYDPEQIAATCEKLIFKPTKIEFVQNSRKGLASVVDNALFHLDKPKQLDNL